jgi:hypothetical protein
MVHTSDVVLGVLKRLVRSRWVLTCAAGLLLPACQIVIGELPPNHVQEQDASTDDGGTAPVEAGDPGDAGLQESVDARAPDPEGGSAVEADAGSEDAGADAMPPDFPCTEDVAWYPDGDGDSYGRSVAASEVVWACPKPRGDWAPRPGDCHDANALVHPGQRSYFGQSYRKPDGTESFDYDCSGNEEGNPSQARGPESCGLLSLTLCAGAGYAPTPRQGQGVDAYCGSTTRATCRPAGLLGCQTVSEPEDEPYRCR